MYLSIRYVRTCPIDSIYVFGTYERVRSMVSMYSVRTVVSDHSYLRIRTHNPSLNVRYLQIRAYSESGGVRWFSMASGRAIDCKNDLQARDTSFNLVTRCAASRRYCNHDLCLKLRWESLRDLLAQVHNYGVSR